jgi:DNA-binding transcriptional regulator YiaG
MTNDPQASTVDLVLKNAIDEGIHNLDALSHHTGLSRFAILQHLIMDKFNNGGQLASRVSGVDLEALAQSVSCAEGKEPEQESAPDNSKATSNESKRKVHKRVYGRMPTSKIEELVASIRAKPGITCDKLARQFGVSTSTIRRILRMLRYHDLFMNTLAMVPHHAYASYANVTVEGPPQGIQWSDKLLRKLKALSSQDVPATGKTRKTDKTNSPEKPPSEASGSVDEAVAVLTQRVLECVRGQKFHEALAMSSAIDILTKKARG